MRGFALCCKCIQTEGLKVIHCPEVVRYHRVYLVTVHCEDVCNWNINYIKRTLKYCELLWSSFFKLQDFKMDFLKGNDIFHLPGFPEGLLKQLHNPRIQRYGWDLNAETQQWGTESPCSVTNYMNHICHQEKWRLHVWFPLNCLLAWISSSTTELS